MIEEITSSYICKPEEIWYIDYDEILETQKEFEINNFNELVSDLSYKSDSPKKLDFEKEKLDLNQLIIDNDRKEAKEKLNGI